MAMQKQIEEWVKKAINGNNPGLCVEIGSRLLYPHDPHDPRPLVNAAVYVGIDANPGPGVDVVSLAHEYTPPAPADLVLCLQALEHDPHWPETLWAGASWVRPGGVFCITCAGKGCAPHELEHSPTPGHYGNVTSREILAALQAFPDAKFDYFTDDSRIITDIKGEASVRWTRSRVMAVRRGVRS